MQAQQRRRRDPFRCSGEPHPRGLRNPVHAPRPRSVCERCTTLNAAMICSTGRTSVLSALVPMKSGLVVSLRFDPGTCTIAATVVDAGGRAQVPPYHHLFVICSSRPCCLVRTCERRWQQFDAPILIGRDSRREPARATRRCTCRTQFVKTTTLPHRTLSGRPS
jgi:hypothetical protein